jgi:hypothetical protein
VISSTGAGAIAGGALAVGSIAIGAVYVEEGLKDILDGLIMPGEGKTSHGEQRHQEGRNGDPHRNIGDANRTKAEGCKYFDNETGTTVYVRVGIKCILKMRLAKR